MLGDMIEDGPVQDIDKIPKVRIHAAFAMTDQFIREARKRCLHGASTNAERKVRQVDAPKTTVPA